MQYHNKLLGRKSKRAESLSNRLSSDLTGAKFRILNEQLYTMNSQDAFEYFKDNEEDFSIVSHYKYNSDIMLLQYHKGFASQVEKWPLNPNELIIKSLKRKKYQKYVIADIGCGEALIAKTLSPLGFKVHSFDLISLNEYVTCCNMKSLPLKDKTVDIAVFCLSLMNTNFDEFIIEANRILKPKGKLVVAEINSRIVSLDSFIEVFKQNEFKLGKQVDLKNFFTVFTFKKVKDSQPNVIQPLNNTYILKPCLYKKR